MADIEDMQRRITQALHRISAATDHMASGGPDQSGEIAALQQALEDEKTVTSQLDERIKGLKEKHATELAEAQSASAGQAEAMAQVDAELQRLRRVTQQLRENNRALREANEKGVAEPHLINKAMLAELEALRAERAADVAEASAILSSLEPMLAKGEGA
ncbi:hypothetical protein [Primorskyibacter sp. S187A]|uniref:hypothetical protein n=1 Tax=Primorskyibacter sp. S187A TaxID=3415130 RepID=UPI003C7C6F84